MLKRQNSLYAAYPASRVIPIKIQNMVLRLFFSEFSNGSFGQNVKAPATSAVAGVAVKGHRPQTTGQVQKYR